MNAGKLKSMELMGFRRRDNDHDNYSRKNYLTPYLVQFVVTTNWTLDWNGVAWDKVFDSMVGFVRSCRWKIFFENFHYLKKWSSVSDKVYTLQSCSTLYYSVMGISVPIYQVRCG